MADAITIKNMHKLDISEVVGSIELPTSVYGNRSITLETLGQYLGTGGIGGSGEVTKVEFDKEVTDRKAADTLIQAEIADLDTRVNTLESNPIKLKTINSESLVGTGNIKLPTQADVVSTADSKVNAYKATVDVELGTIKTNIATLDTSVSDLNTKTASLDAGQLTLTTNLAQEVSNRTSADTALGVRITNLDTKVTASDTKLQTLETETTDLDTRVTALEDTSSKGLKTINGESLVGAGDIDLPTATEVSAIASVEVETYKRVTDPKIETLEEETTELDTRVSSLENAPSLELKTINGETLIGAGDITIDTTGMTPEQVAKLDSIEEGAQKNPELKTVNGEVLVGSGNIVITGDAEGLEFQWQGTELGVKKESETSYTYVDLQGTQGIQGEKGDQGQDGQDGKPFLYTDFTPEQLDALKGNQGEKGADGYTPIKGVDYFDGVRGERGERGEKGEQGEQGIQGIQGLQGVKGEKGEGFNIVKTYNSIAEMEADFSNTDVLEGQLVMITTDESNEDNARVYAKDAAGFTFIVDLSGVQGIRGEKGEQGIQGIQGLQGEAGRDAEVTPETIQVALGYTPASSDTVDSLSATATTHLDTNNSNAHSIDNITGLRAIVDSLEPSSSPSWAGSLNDINRTGWVLAEANTTSEKPVGAYNFYVNTIIYNNNYALQVAYLSTGSESFTELLYTRRKVGGTWLSWSKVLTEKDFVKANQDYIPYLGNLKDINYNAKVYAHGVVPDRPIIRTSFYVDVIVRGDNPNYRLIIARPIDDNDEYYLRMINGVWQDWKKYPHQYMSAGSPEGVQVGIVGTFYTNTTNGSLYYKQTGTGSTGWKMVSLV